MVAKAASQNNTSTALVSAMLFTPTLKRNCGLMVEERKKRHGLLEGNFGTIQLSLLRPYKRRKNVNNYVNNIDLRDANYGTAVRECLSLSPRGCKKIPSLVITDGIFKDWPIPRKDDRFYALGMPDIGEQ